MDLQEKLQFCRVCTNRKFTNESGIVCGLTNEKPAFEDKCEDFNHDEEEYERIQTLKNDAVESEAEEGGYFSVEKKGIQKGVMGGILMMVIAAIWFYVGWEAGYIYFYPPILFVIGAFAFIKGLVTGNISGKK